jgi:hypothetical protein
MGFAQEEVLLIPSEEGETLLYSGTLTVGSFVNAPFAQIYGFNRGSYGSVNPNDGSLRRFFCQNIFGTISFVSTYASVSYNNPAYAIVDGTVYTNVNTLYNYLQTKNGQTVNIELYDTLQN